MATDLEDTAENPSSTTGAAFIPVTGDVVDLGDMKVTGYEGTITSGFEVQTLDEYGDSDRFFQWLDAKTKTSTFYGWYEDGVTPYDDLEEEDRVRIQPGSGLCVFVDDPSMKIQSAGQVPSADVGVELIADEGLIVANPTPVEVDLGSTKISGYTGQVTSGVELQTLDEYGDSDRFFQWLDAKTKTSTFYGWYEDGITPYDDLEEEDKIIFKPGQGGFMVIENQDYEFVWPKVSL